MIMVADGAGNRAIAQQLGIKENTVKKSLVRIYDKLGVCNRVELVLYALTHRGVGTIPAPALPTVAPEEFAIDSAALETNALRCTEGKFELSTCLLKAGVLCPSKSGLDNNCSVCRETVAGVIANRGIPETNGLLSFSSASVQY